MAHDVHPDPRDDRPERVFRELYSEEEARQFTRPEFQLPTRQIAFWSVAVSLLFAGALVGSWLVERHQRVSAPAQKQASGNKSSPRSATPYATSDSAPYLRRQTN